MLKFLFSLSSLLLFFQLHAQDAGPLTVSIDGLKAKNKGQLIIMIFDQEEGFPKVIDNAKYQGKIKQIQTETSYTFPNIPYGNYAISVFLDENKNGKMDSNMIGFPKEPIGATNLKRLGRPSFSKATVAFSAAASSFTIKLLNN